MSAEGVWCAWFELVTVYCITVYCSLITPAFFFEQQPRAQLMDWMAWLVWLTVAGEVPWLGLYRPVVWRDAGVWSWQAVREAVNPNSKPKAAFLVTFFMV
jgi:hypothetical protein